MPSTPPPSADAGGVVDVDLGPSSVRGWSVADVAERVGVAAATLRAWERRYGVGPTSRTTGGHRRYSNADVAALQRLKRLTRAGMPTGSAALLAFATTGREEAAAPITGSTPQTSVEGDRLAERFAAAVDGLDPDRIARTADALLAERGAVAAWTQVFTPQLQGLGRRWETTGLGVEREHVAVDVLQACLARYTRGHSRRHPQDGLRVLAAATPAERHTLPLVALAAALAESGVRAYVVRALPEPALHTAVQDTGASVAVLWARSAETADAGVLRGLLTRTPALCAAGAGWRGPRLPRSVPQLPDLPSAVETVLAWAT